MSAASLYIYDFREYGYLRNKLATPWGRHKKKSPRKRAFLFVAGFPQGKENPGFEPSHGFCGETTALQEPDWNAISAVVAVLKPVKSNVGRTAGYQVQFGRHRKRQYAQQHRRQCIPVSPHILSCTLRQAGVKRWSKYGPERRFIQSGCIQMVVSYEQAIIDQYV